MKHFCLLCLLLACNLPLLAVEGDVYEVTLSDGRTMTGILEETGIDRYTIHMLFNGRVMGSKEVTASDIKSKRIVQKAEDLKKEEEKKEAAKEGEGEQESKPSIPSQKGSLSTKYLESVSELNDAQRAFEGRIENLNVRATSLTLREGIDESLKLARTALKKYVSKQKQVGDLAVAMLRVSGKDGIKEARARYRYLAESIETAGEAEIALSQSRNEQSAMILAWFETANLEDAELSQANGDQEKEKWIKKLNPALKNLRKIRDSRQQASYGTARDFIEHNKLFSIYTETR